MKKGRFAHALCAAALGLLLCALPCAGGAEAAQAHSGTQEISGAARVQLGGDISALPAGVRGEEDTFTFTKAGTYLLTGELAGQVVVDADGRAQVTLVLDGASIENPQGSAIYVKKAGMVTLLLAEGSANRVVSGEAAALDGSAIDQNAEGGAIHAKEDVTIAGEGALFVGGYINNGIHTSKRLTIAGGEVTVEAVNNGIKGKDAVSICGGNVRVTSGGDGVVSDDTSGEGCGVVAVSGGRLEIISQEDGVQAATLLEVTDGEIAVVAGGGSANAQRKSEDFGFGGGFGGRGMGGRGGFVGNNADSDGFVGRRAGRQGMGRRGGFDAAADAVDQLPEGFAEPPEGVPGDIGEPPAGMLDGIGEPPEGVPDGIPGDFAGIPQEMPGDSAPESEEAEPTGAKGLKSDGVLRIAGGAVTVDSADDAIHANGSVEVTGGVLALSAGDDGMHADQSLTIDGGDITVVTSYEGIEANQIGISGGTVSVTASDDGLNANGGTQIFWGRRGPREQADQQGGEMPNLLITGGTVYVNAEGDGLDSNGNILVEGGMIVVDGPSRSGNGALDSGSESGGTCRITGGTVLAIGAAGMDETFDGDSEQVSFQHSFDRGVQAGSEIAVTAEDGTVLFTHTTAKTFQSVVFSSPELAQGMTVTLTAGEQSAQVTLNSISTRSGAVGGWGRW